jgi:hypothetical protein
MGPASAPKSSRPLMKLFYARKGERDAKNRASSIEEMSIYLEFSIKEFGRFESNREEGDSG